MNTGAMGIIQAAEPSLLYGLYAWGIALIKGIQTIEHPALTAVIRFLTGLGTELFYIPVILFILWCVDEKQGARFCILVLLSAWVNGFFKNLLKQPRPYDLDPSVGRGFEPSYGIPSGHAQQSLAFWGAAALWAGKWTGKTAARTAAVRWVAAVLFILIIAFTRLYLGLHFPTDILAGWVLGVLLLVLYSVFGSRLEAFLAARGTRFQMICAAIIALLINGFGGGSNLGGMLLGFCAGYSLMIRHVRFSARSPVRGERPGGLILAARYFTGIAGAGIIYIAMKFLLPGEGSLFAALPGWGFASPYYELGRFLRYGSMGLWAAAGAPWVFCRVGLAEAAPGPSTLPAS
jgi:membrane-associated phospholipid phosphatase